MIMKVKLLFVLLIQLVTVTLGAVLKLDPILGTNLGGQKPNVVGNDSNESAESNESFGDNEMLKTSATFHRRYHYPSYYHQPYYNRYPQRAHYYYNRPAPVYQYQYTGGYDSDSD
ncbi:hypothetical protein DAPPUDRAFT_311022 [Daphnia pulex]|uniref:Uncharacterized protein n=1 Tax=Daphnia pulex TaxID=6669 RepID=E9FUD7_DAPPU|nr:hypothetical protein DAPPUDRAFT_311022 [Daphnia pulex]|eukprot:EFX88707.1 hypothetical protein DAPPUDRAFT_311022 [Daphnia pulex]